MNTPTPVRRISFLVLTAEAFGYGLIGGVVGGIAGWWIGVGMLAANPMLSMIIINRAGYSFSFFPALGAAIGIASGLWIGIYGRIMANRRFSWKKGALYGGLSFGSLLVVTPCGLVGLYPIDWAGIIWLIGFAGGALIGAIFCTLLSFLTTAPAGPKDCP